MVRVSNIASRMDVAIEDTIAAHPDVVFRRIAWRVMPFIFLLFMFAFLDRINIGYAILQMRQDLHLTDSQFGFAAGLFSISYMIFEFPITMMAPRVGARRTFLRISILWGLTSAATALVRNATELYAVRFLLGAFEAGVLPITVLFVTNWFPTAYRGRMTAIFMLSTGIAGLVGAPASGYIIYSMDGIRGLAGWQWMYILEGLPIIVVGIASYFALADHPESARWLTEGERTQVFKALGDDAGAGKSHMGGIGSVIADWRIYMLAFLIFAATSGGYALNIWLPTIIKSLGVGSVVKVGLLASIPFFFGCVGFIAVGFSSDYFKERRWHYALPAILAAVGLFGSTQFSGSPVWVVACFCLVSFMISGVIGVFWAIPSTFMSKRSSPAGLALVNYGNLAAGFAIPSLIGVVRDLTGSTNGGLLAICAILCVASAMMIWAVPGYMVRVGSSLQEGSQ